MPTYTKFTEGKKERKRERAGRRKIVQMTRCGFCMLCRRLWLPIPHRTAEKGYFMPFLISLSLLESSTSGAVQLFYLIQENADEFFLHFFCHSHCTFRFGRSGNFIRANIALNTCTHIHTDAHIHTVGRAHKHMRMQWHTLSLSVRLMYNLCSCMN